MNKTEIESKDEELFWSNYRMEDYARPSIAADVVAFAMKTDEIDNWRKDCQDSHLSVLLVRRGEYPFMNQWALPGGFLEMDETLEECALREIKEETGIVPVSIMQIGAFSKCDRDPRGRIISVAYTTIVREMDAKLMSDNDAIEAKWFELEFERENDGICILKLKHDDIVLNTQLSVRNNSVTGQEYEVTGTSELAFDHAVIIAAALKQLREKAEKFDVIFDFLPEKFTLTALQKVQETILDVSILPANFRRKIADYVLETQEFTTGAGHRPAKLFVKKR